MEERGPSESVLERGSATSSYIPRVVAETGHAKEG